MTEEAEKVSVAKEEYEKFLSQAKELEGLRDQFLRSAADFDNARKRLTKEKEEFLRFSQENLLRDILPVLDNFERALAHSDQPALSAGIELIRKQWVDVLSRHGLRRYHSQGQLFDPHLHEAVDQVKEEGPEGVILKEIVAGYRLHDRVFRPAKVVIRVHPAKADEVKPAVAEEKSEEIT